MNKPAHMYLRTTGRHPIGIVMLELVADGELRIASSICRKGDRWDREKGLALTRERLQNEDTRVVVRRSDGPACLVDLLKVLQPSRDFYIDEVPPWSKDRPYLTESLLAYNRVVKRLLETPEESEARQAEQKAKRDAERETTRLEPVP